MGVPPGGFGGRPGWSRPHRRRSVHGMRRRRKYALVLWLLCLLFALRVLGQGIQFWTTVPWLPGFESFQGSGMPYWALLSAQALILVVVAHASWRVQRGMVEPRRERGGVLLWLGGIYLAGSLGRIAVGLVPGAPGWFRAWIPGAFHVVLACYVVTLGAYHVRLSHGAVLPPPDLARRRRGTTASSVTHGEGEIGPMANSGRRAQHG